MHGLNNLNPRHFVGFGNGTVQLLNNRKRYTIPTAFVRMAAKLGEKWG